MLRPWPRAVKASTTRFRLSRGVADLRPFREGDIALLRRKEDRSAPPVLTRPLQAGRKVEGHRGVVRHDDILGKSVRDLVSVQPKRQRDGEEGRAPRKGDQQYRLHEVKLDEYVRLTKRLVTPIYPADARLIVDLLDLHPQALLNGEVEEKLVILEAGTGHGALTLYLARAICGANKALPKDCKLDEDAEAVSSWKADRRAVIHTIDVSEKYSRHAEDVVKGFKSGLYYPHVDFHVGDVGEWTTSALSDRQGKPFLSHAFLDLPSADGKLDAVTNALRVDGCVFMFNPSITQIMDAAKKTKEHDIPLDLERVVELGVNGGSGGREWDVRPVKPRAAQKLQREEESRVESEHEDETGRDEEQVAVDTVKADAKDGWFMVCRPKVGERVVGGGFLGVWKKQRRAEDSS